MKTLQERLRDYLKSTVIKQKQFAETIDVSPQILSMWLHNKVSLNHSTIEQIKTIVDS